MSFEEYLTEKRIDSTAFLKAEPERWNEFQNLFDQVHPNSFTIQKLNLINTIRRKYLLQVTAEEKEVVVPKKPASGGGPVFKKKEL
jgi:hypothetical protein